METLIIQNHGSKHNVLLSPMNLDELENNVRKDGTIQAKVLIDFTDMINYDLDWFNNEISEKITGSVCSLSDISYEISGKKASTNDLIVKVTATVEF